MEDRPLARYSIVDLVVVGHQHYGLLVQSDAGERGFVDALEIADRGMSVDEWPAVGERLTGVVLGHSGDGRIRACVAPGYVTFVESVEDPAGALAEWSQVLRTENDGARRGFYRSENAVHLLRWAKGRQPQSDDHKKAMGLLWEAPEVLREAVFHPEKD